MGKRIIVALLGAALLATGCGKSGGSLEITENGTYDVSGYSEVRVTVGEGEQTADPDGAPVDAESDDGLKLVRVQLKDFSMEVPAEFVENYTEQELVENDLHTFYGHDELEGSDATAQLSISAMAAYGDPSETLSLLFDAPQEDVNGITMAIKHTNLGGNTRCIEIGFVYGEKLYSLSLLHDVGLDGKYESYDDNFFRTIQMNSQE